jgi:hypothetical protein
MMAVGAVTGLAMGLWSFDGPMPVPAWLGDYGSTARRLIRLGHIACFGVGILNLLLIGEAERRAVAGLAFRWASRLMNVGNIGLPLGLFAAAAFPPVKYLLALPAMAVTVSLVLVTRETLRSVDARRTP